MHLFHHRVGDSWSLNVSPQSHRFLPQKGDPRFWWQRSVKLDPDAIATQRSVYDHAETANKYQPRDDWENIHRFDPLFRWTWGEEYKLVRRVDLLIMGWVCIMFMALEIDRSNLGQALTDNFLGDLHLTTNDFNLGNTVTRVSFLLAELPSQLVSKWVGPDRWIPAQLVLWSIVAASQFWLNGRASFLATRVLLGMLQGGFIPDVILYLSYFYKHHELSIRLSFFWAAMSIADIMSAILAFGILRMRGVGGHSGWRWLFLIEGLLTLVVGIFSFALMPAGPAQTASWFRGKKGWFTEREEKIIINRVIRDDPTKGSMHNRQPVTPKLLWQSLKDYDLWPMYILGLTFQIPSIPQQIYLTLSLRGLGFNTFETNLLTIPYTVLHIIAMFAITVVAETWGQLAFTALAGQIWILPFLIYLNIVDTTKVSRWTIWAVTSLLLAYPNAHAIQVGWNSRNSNTVRTRTVSAACYNMFVQGSVMISANIYRMDDAPRYQRGNRQLLAICCMNIVLYPLVKSYYVWRNKSKDEKWNKMDKDERDAYLEAEGRQDRGNKRLDFRFAH
ncbi:phthalate transporter [Eremomyces bilateralis CBS 781.70]|uniref:Phthalate transporter n=1 Tax=Eremomyces bilateralis CBS 781.70 TaxID=1392243 RepID=A0A6G1G5S2_9PEZI|nr:phthalate transporter [Eremomyces bilateralis CBS 781.70]KAF1813445.1 phthalate transporter [Eremomyces bilateralis CBS 781.70]